MGRLREDLSRLREKTRKHRRVMGAVGVVALVAVACKPPIVQTTTGVIDFESPAYTTGTINGQNGWSSLGAAGSGCAVYDHEVDNIALSGTEPSDYGFGGQSLRMSDSVTSGCFGDQTFSPQTTDEAGEQTSSNNGLHSGGTKRGFFETSWSFGDAGNPFAEQPGLHVVASPDRGDGARMSWVEMQDCGATLGTGDECQNGAGLEVNFFGYDTTVDDFVFQNVAHNLDRSTAHTIRLRMWFFEGADNDVVQVCVDGTTCFTGNSWEDFFRDGANCSPTPCPEAVPTVDSVLFRTGGTADPGNAGNGFFIDNFEARTANYTGAAFNVSEASTSVLEGNAGTTLAPFQVALDAPVPFETTVHYTTQNGTATAANSDFVAQSGDLTFPANSVAPQTVNVVVNGDTVDETHEAFSLIISNPVSHGLDNNSGAESFPRYVSTDQDRKQKTILDDDSTLRINDVSQNEGNTGQATMAFNVTLDNPSAVNVTVHVQSSNGSAVAPTDYTGISANLTFLPGEVSKFTTNPQIKGDFAPEANETIIVTLSAPGNGAFGDPNGVGFILNDD